MRPLPTSPTNTFQSPKVATSDGLAGSSFAPDLGAGLAALVAATAGGRKALAAQPVAATSPTARRDERTRRVIKNNPLSPARPYGQTRAAGFPAARSGRNSGLPPCRPTQGLQSCIWLLKNE